MGLLKLLIYICFSVPLAFIITLLSLFLIEKFANRFSEGLPWYFPTARNTLKMVIESAIENYFVKFQIYRLSISLLLPILAFISSIISIQYFLTFFNPTYLNDIKFNLFAVLFILMFIIIGYFGHGLFYLDRYAKGKSLKEMVRLFSLNILIYVAFLALFPLAGLLIYEYFPQKVCSFCILFFLVSPIFVVGLLIGYLSDFLIEKGTIFRERILDYSFHKTNKMEDLYCRASFSEKLLIQRILISSWKNSVLYNHLMNFVLLGIYDLLIKFGIFRYSQGYFNVRAQLFYNWHNLVGLEKSINDGISFIRKSGEQESQTLATLQALFLIKCGKYDEAEEALINALSKWRENPHLWLHLSHVYWQKGNLNKAMECNNSVLNIDPNCPLSLSYKVQYGCEEILLHYRPNSSRIENEVLRVSEDLLTAFSEARKRFSNVSLPPVLFNAVGLFALLRGDFIKAIDFFEYGALTHSHSDSLLYLGLISQIGEPLYIRSEYFLTRILSALNVNQSNRVYKIAQKNLEKEINFNEKIVWYPFFEDDDIPVEAVIKGTEELDRVINLKRKKIFRLDGWLFYNELLRTLNINRIVGYINTSVQKG